MRGVGVPGVVGRRSFSNKNDQTMQKLNEINNFLAQKRGGRIPTVLKFRQQTRSFHSLDNCASNNRSASIIIGSFSAPARTSIAHSRSESGLCGSTVGLLGRLGRLP